MMYKFSTAGIKNKEIYCRIYSDFVQWCKNNFEVGMFSTYCDGEPVFLCCGSEISYSRFKEISN